MRKCSGLWMVTAVALGLILGIGQTTAPSAPDQQKQRGEQLHLTLQKFLKEVALSGGNFPAAFTSSPGEKLTYVRPEGSLDSDMLRGACILLHESPELHPDGLWVGYADGDVTYLKDVKQLSALIERGKSAQRALRPVPVTAQESARLERGRALRKVLLPAMEEAFAHDGNWPEKIDAKDIVYLRPPKLVLDDRSMPTCTPVMHEAARESGTWIGFADGHMEFAPDGQTLAEALGQQAMAAKAVDVRARLLEQWQATTRAAATSPTTEPATMPGSLRIRVVDAAGKPVAGAMLGQYGNFGKESQPRPCYFASGGPVARDVTTDARGEAVVEAGQVFIFKFRQSPQAPLWILHPQRELAAYEMLTPGEFSRGGVKEIRLQPACRVSGHFTGVGLESTAGRVLWCNTMVFSPGDAGNRTLECYGYGDNFEFLLPPGEYQLSPYGNNVYGTNRMLKIAPGRREARLELDLVPETVAALVKQPAPELREIKAWKNGGPVTLAQLKGKAVVLDFWGYWCGPCIGSMPGLMKLHERYKDQGLVIIAVHDDSVATIAEMDEKLSEDRRKYWNGKDLPFLVAIDGGGQRRIASTARTSKGATHAAYGIQSWPTTLLIGKDGKVIGDLRVQEDGTSDQVEKALAQ